MIRRILEAISEKGYAADNLAFGSGGALLQKVDRDTQKCAFKCSMAQVNGESVQVFKDPITDPGKTSKKGKLTLEKRDGKYVTRTNGEGDPKDDHLVTVFLDGIIEKEFTFADIKCRAGVSIAEEKNPRCTTGKP